MTSKKCLVMNLKLGRARIPNALEKNRGPLKRTPNNNNLTTSPNHNSYLPILPKYSEAAAAAFLQSSLASNSSMSPFYLTPPGLLNASHPITPYSMPNLGHIFEQLHQQQASPLRPPVLDNSEPLEDYKSRNSNGVESPVNKEREEVIPKSSASSCGGELVMDEDLDDEVKKIKTEVSESRDLEAVKRILETVNATVTKQLLQANIQKFSSESSSDCPSIASLHSPKQCHIESHPEEYIDHHHHQHSEGLAAKLEDIVAEKNESSVHSCEENKHDEEMDCESVTTTDHVSEDGRKVRVRSLISDEQLKILKDNYKLNPRPKREDLEKIADSIGFPVRVVQVWFQNTRARDRREGRLIQVPYSPVPQVPLRYPMVPFNKIPITPPNSSYISEQPLDLSTKRCVGGPSSVESSPTSSPRSSSVSHYQENTDDMVMNLSRTPRQSPSPLDFNNTSRLAQILAQPAHKLPGLLPMDQLMQMGAAGDLPTLSQLISSRLNSLSPNSKKRVWTETRELRTDSYQDDESRCKMSQFMFKSLGSPVLGNQDGEMEGQFSCDQCDKGFSKQSSLARHKYEHSGNWAGLDTFRPMSSLYFGNGGA